MMVNAAPSEIDPATIERLADEAWQLVRPTAGFLSERETRFLVLAAAGAPGAGSIVEIGSFKGRSTVALAHVAKRLGLGKVVAVDPHTSPSSTDPDLRGATTTFDEFQSNLARANVADHVEAHRLYSRDLARIWSGPIRLLWVDGDHTYAGAKEDIDLFRQHLAPGAIVAMHDVLGTFEGSLRVFVEHVLGSDDFGPAGFCDSIGWAQYRPVDGGSPRFRRLRSRLALPARRIIPIAQRARVTTGLDKRRYRFWRMLVPHGRVNPARWLRQVRIDASSGDRRGAGAPPGRSAHSDMRRS